MGQKMIKDIFEICRDCTGCRACENSCPVSAICMVSNVEGFIYPSIDWKQCIHCGLCKKICPQLNKIQIERLKNPKVYAAQLYDDTVLKSSTSGAFFAALAMKVLEYGGNVYGVKFDNNIASFCSADTFEKLNRIRGSKYISSDTGNVFKKVKADLEKNRIVLFSGCPCQVAGLRAFLKKDYENLLAVDIVCHGTPSSVP